MKNKNLVLALLTSTLMSGNALTDINVFGKLAGEEISKEKN